jgi:hypothetical protein
MLQEGSSNLRRHDRRQRPRIRKFLGLPRPELGKRHRPPLRSELAEDSLTKRPRLSPVAFYEDEDNEADEVTVARILSYDDENDKGDGEEGDDSDEDEDEGTDDGDDSDNDGDYSDNDEDDSEEGSGANPYSNAPLQFPDHSADELESENIEANADEEIYIGRSDHPNEIHSNYSLLKFLGSGNNHYDHAPLEFPDHSAVELESENIEAYSGQSDHPDKRHSNSLLEFLGSGVNPYSNAPLEFLDHSADELESENIEANADEEMYIGQSDHPDEIHSNYSLLKFLGSGNNHYDHAPLEFPDHSADELENIEANADEEMYSSQSDHPDESHSNESLLEFLGFSVDHYYGDAPLEFPNDSTDELTKNFHCEPVLRPSVESDHEYIDISNIPGSDSEPDNPSEVHSDNTGARGNASSNAAMKNGKRNGDAGKDAGPSNKAGSDGEERTRLFGDALLVCYKTRKLLATSEQLHRTLTSKAWWTVLRHVASGFHSSTADI